MCVIIIAISIIISMFIIQLAASPRRAPGPPLPPRRGPARAASATAIPSGNFAQPPFSVVFVATHDS